MSDKGFAEWGFNSKHNNNDTPNLNNGGRYSSTSPYTNRSTSPHDDKRGRHEPVRSTTPEYESLATDRHSTYKDYRVVFIKCRDLGQK